MDGPELHVTGGAAGAYASYADLRTLAVDSDDLAAAVSWIAVRCHEILAHPDVLASAALDPAGFAHVEGALLAALDGRQGLTALAARFAERSVALRAATASYQAVDAARARTLDALRWEGGFLAGGTLLATFPAGPVLLGGLSFAGYKLDLFDERLLTDHPGLVDDVVGAGPGLLSSLGLVQPDVSSAAHLIGDFYPDGAPTVRPLSAPAPDPMTQIPPGGLGDVMAGLDYRNQRSDDGQDQIDVRVIARADGTKAFIVDIPGTKVWDTPWQGFNPHLNDLGTNIHLMAGDTTSREHAIALALAHARAGPDDPIMLVGHSQGGMVAAQAAHDSATGAFPYHVTHVMTAGSPIGRVDIPPEVQVLALENSHDIVPHLDARDNADRPNLTTVTFDHQQGSIEDNHSTTTSYLPAARALDGSTDPSVAAYRDSATAFLAGDRRVRTDVFVIERTP